MLKSLQRVPYTLLYLASILIVTILFKYFPLLVTLAPKVQITPWTVLVGGWFVLRDFSQREVGHYVFIPMIIGVLTGAVISPSLAVASLLASGASELADWTVYTFTRKPFHQRVLISSFISAPLDTLIFFSAFDFFNIIPGVSIFNWPTVILGSLSKILAAVFIYFYYKRRANA